MERRIGEGIDVMDGIRTAISKLKTIRLHEKTKITVEWLIQIRDAKTEKLLKEIRRKNIITNGGLSIFAQALRSPFIGYDSTRYYWYLVLGTGAGVPAATDTALFTPIAASAKHGTLTYVGAVATYYARYLPEDANGYTYTEAGIYDKVGYTNSTPNAYTTGTLLNHLMLVPTLPKDATILVDFYITVTFS